jgi:hypothetical protein
VHHKIDSARREALSITTHFKLHGEDMSNKRDIHVVPHENGWATRKENAERAGGVYDTKSEALEHGRHQARREGVELVIHRKDGTIHDSDSYGNDPNPPKDRVR